MLSKDPSKGFNAANGSNSRGLGGGRGERDIPSPPVCGDGKGCRKSASPTPSADSSPRGGSSSGGIRTQTTAMTIHLGFYNKSLGGEAGMLLISPSAFMFHRLNGFDGFSTALNGMGPIDGTKASGGGMGVALPFGGFSYGEEQQFVIRRILDMSRVPGSGKWDDSFIRMITYCPFPAHHQGDFYVRFAVKGDTTPAPDFIPLAKDFRLQKDREQVYHRLTDLRNVRHLVQIRAGDVVYNVQSDTEGDFPRGLYRTNVLTRFAMERNNVFAPTPVVDALFKPRPLEIIDLRSPSISPVEKEGSSKGENVNKTTAPKEAAQGGATSSRASGVNTASFVPIRISTTSQEIRTLEAQPEHEEEEEEEKNEKDEEKNADDFMEAPPAVYDRPPSPIKLHAKEDVNNDSTPDDKNTATDVPTVVNNDEAKAVVASKTRQKNKPSTADPVVGRRSVRLDMKKRKRVNEDGEDD